MSGVNKMILVGRLGQDPELKQLENGRSVVNFTVATNEHWVDKTTGKRNERTEWHRVVAWGKTAELVAQYLSKGREVFIEGRLQTRTWERDGKEHRTTEIVASHVTFLGSKQAA